MAKVVVIGAGMGGMAVAARLAVKRHEVTVGFGNPDILEGLTRAPRWRACCARTCGQRRCWTFHRQCSPGAGATATMRRISSVQLLWRSFW